MTCVVRHHRQRQPSGAARVERLQADDAAGARLVVDDDRTPERLRQRRLRRARDRVDARAGGIGRMNLTVLSPTWAEAAPAAAASAMPSIRRGGQSVEQLMLVSCCVSQATAACLLQLCRSRRRRSRGRPAARRCARPACGGSRRTPSRSPASVIGNSAVLTVSPACAPPGTVGQVHVGQAAGGEQVRVVVQILGPADRRERQAHRFEARRQLGRRCAALQALGSAAAAAWRAARHARCSPPAPGRPSGRRSRARRRTSATAHR